MERIVVAGAGLAGAHAVQALRRGGFGGEIVVVGAERHAPYDRPPLSKQLLAGTMGADALALDLPDTEATWLLGVAAAGLDVEGRRVVLSDGRVVAYDGLVIATGRRARPAPVPVPPGVLMLRDLEDAETLAACAAVARRVVVVGAGFVGCEVAATLRARADPPAVTVVDVATHPLPVVGPEVGAFARALHERHGVRFHLGAAVAAIEARGGAYAVRLADADATTLAADLVLVAVGSLPNGEWLAGSGLALEGGCVCCDAYCFAVGRDDVVAAGDVATWEQDGLVCVEHWTNARDMARVAAANLLAGRSGAAAYAPLPSFWSDQYDVKIKSLGFLRRADRIAIVEADPERGRLIAEAWRGDELVGVVLCNRNRALLDYQRRLLQGATVAASVPDARNAVAGGAGADRA